MINRREIIAGLTSLAALASSLNPAMAVQPKSSLNWVEFTNRMDELAQRFASGKVGQQKMEQGGLALISRLDIDSASFRQAENNSFESGNAFWLWQRMLRTTRLDGGILNIDQTQMIPLHDHPGATGMVRIISGEAEVWKFQRADSKKHQSGMADLKLVFRGILGPGDTATVTPQNGNIHALRAVSKECRMLDFFIPPFDRRSLLYFKPDHDNWFDKTQISCRAIGRNEFTRM